MGLSGRCAVAGGVATRSAERVLGAVLIAPAGIPGALVYCWPKNLLCRPGFLNRLGLRLARTALFRRAFPFRLVRQHLGLLGSFDDDYTRALEYVRSPMMLIWSSGDRRCLPEYAAVYSARVANIDVRILSDEVGHMVPMVEPTITAEPVGELVDRLGLESS